MKRLINTTIGAVSLLWATQASASPYYSTITNLWHTGRQTNVLQMAEARLARNTNDIAGVLMKASWDFAFSDAVTLSNSLNRIISVGAGIQTTHFTNEFRITRVDVACILDTIHKETAKEKTEAVIKEGGEGKEIPFVDELKALDDDGFFAGEGVYFR